MKKIGIYLLAACAALPMLQSCNENEGERVAFVWTNVQPLMNGDYYFKLDNGKTAYPSDKSRIGNYEATEGQRAVVYHQMLDKKAEGYDYNFKLFAIDNILTKGPKTVTTQDELDAIGDDKIDIRSLQISGGYLDIQFGLIGSSESKHELNLIVNKVSPPSTDDSEGYTLVEFRHNANGASSGYYSENLVSFRLGDLDPAVSGSKGLCIRVKPVTVENEEISYIKVEPIRYDR